MRPTPAATSHARTPPRSLRLKLKEFILVDKASDIVSIKCIAELTFSYCRQNSFNSAYLRLGFDMQEGLFGKYIDYATETNAYRCLM